MQRSTKQGKREMDLSYYLLTLLKGNAQSFGYKISLFRTLNTHILPPKSYAPESLSRQRRLSQEPARK